VGQGQPVADRHRDRRRIAHSGGDDVHTREAKNRVATVCPELPFAATRAMIG